MVAAGTATVEKCNTPNNNSPLFSELPKGLRELLFFAKPDVVICYDNGRLPIAPIFAFEVTNHVPARDHWLQRFNNLVGCAQIGVPGAYVIPFDLSNRPQFSGVLDSAFFYAYDRVTEIHGTPFYIAEWESSDKETLNSDAAYADLPDHESTPIARTFEFLNKVIATAISGNSASSLVNERIIVELKDDLRRRAYSPVPAISHFERLTKNMPDGRFLTIRETKEWIENKGITMPSNLPDRIEKRNKNLIFSPVVQERGRTQDKLRDSLKVRIHDKGGDPYLGQPLAFDYIFCRLGKTPYERDSNLIIDLSLLHFSDYSRYHKKIWEACPLQHDSLDNIRNIPQYTMSLTEGCAQIIKNFIRVYAFTADIIVFNDGMVYFS
jgi:hypothetical protein